MAKIQRYIVKRGKRNAIFRFFHTKNDREAIAAWMLDLNKIRRVFNVCPLYFLSAIVDFLFPDRTWDNRRRKYPGRNPDHPQRYS